jgi:hypothetical protein
VRAAEGKKGESGGEAAALTARREELTRLRVELRGCEIAEENLRSAYSTELAKSMKDRDEMSDERLSLKFKKDELDEAQAVLKRIQDRIVAYTTERSAPTRIKWHESAKVPQVPLEVVPIKKMCLAAAAGYCFPYVAGFIALVLWNLSLLIAKLEPAPAEGPGAAEASVASDAKAGP